MKVLFVSSGNADTINGITTIVFNQGRSLEEKGIDIDYFGIKAKGLIGYYNSIAFLKKKLLSSKYDIIHSHYGLCGIVSYFAHTNEKLIQSYMGSDIYGNFQQRKKSSFSSELIAFVNRKFKSRYDYCITKSDKMRNLFRNKSKIEVIPNGVNFQVLEPLDKIGIRKDLGLQPDKRIVLFPAKRDIKRKNYQLVEQAVKALNRDDVEILAYDGIPFNMVNSFLNAADVCMLPSFAEGSPNAIKEAMAVSIPIVATDVGDVRELISDTEGCYVCGFDIADASEKLEKALNFGKRTTGRKDVEHLRSDIIAKKILDIYEKVLHYNRI